MDHKKPTEGEKTEAQTEGTAQPLLTAKGDWLHLDQVVGSCHRNAPVCWSLHGQTVKFHLWVYFWHELGGVGGRWHRAEMLGDTETGHYFELPTVRQRGPQPQLTISIALLVTGRHRKG